jgi:general secretion pathway protein N
MPGMSRLRAVAFPGAAAVRRWGLLGVAAGTLSALVAFAPASWLAGALHRATDGRLLLAEARGSIWRGSAVAVLTGGPGSRDAAALPGRLHWRLGWAGTTVAGATAQTAAAVAGGPSLALRQDCCIDGVLRLRFGFGPGGWHLALPPGDAPQVLGQWPAAWLTGLGTPFNTLQPSGVLRLSSAGYSLAGGGLSGSLELSLEQMAARVSTLPVLGSYRLRLQGPAQGHGPAQVQLSTRDGALLLTGAGEWGAGGLRFRGEARAAPEAEAVLNNLLNIIGRRQGAASLIAIG